MIDRPELPTPESEGYNAACRLGFWVALLTATVAAAAFALGVTTPPRSGPFCTASCLAYPYSAAAQFVPRDYRWIYLAILLAPLLAVLMACIHASAAAVKRVFSLLAFGFALASAVVISIDYFIQIEVMQPSLLRGETDGLTLFSQYNPHGVFIALEDLGYLLMSVAFLFAGLVFTRGKGLERAMRWTLLIASLLAFTAYAGMAIHFGTNLEYRFEVTIITINWTALLVVGVLLSLWFRRGGQPRIRAS